MTNQPTPLEIATDPKLMIWLGWYAVAGCVIFAMSILVADVVVPDHDWIADTISDLGAGRYEFIVDIGIYAFAASVIATALLAAHFHLGGWAWSLGIVGLALLGLIVILIGARNEYGDNDSEGVVIHVYLVYVLGFLMTVIPLAMSRGARRAGKPYRTILIGIFIVWTASAPVFFLMPTNTDGIYERYLGLIAFSLIFTLAHLFITQARRHR